MTKSNTKRALTTSALAMVLCVAMLIGTTFAWFTDTASTSVNKIQAGNLDVALEMATAWDKDGTVTKWDSAEGQTLQFKKASGATADEKVLWEPGCTYELPELRVVNEGDLALKYEIKITGINGDAKLNEAIEWTLNGTKIGTTIGNLKANASSDALTIKGHMKEEAGNEYQGLSIDGIAITVYATQDTVEYDSKNNTYDANAFDALAALYPVYASAEVTDQGAEVKADTVAVSIPKDAIANDATSVSVTVTKDADVNANFKVSSAENVTLQQFEVNVTGIKEDNSTDITLQMFIGKGFNFANPDNLTVQHLKKDGSVEKLTGAKYDSKTGFVTFTTKSFSPFAIEIPNVDAVAGTGIETTYYSSLADAVAVGGTVTILRDVTLAAPMEITKTVTLKGNNYTMTTASGTRVINVNDNIEALTLSLYDVHIDAAELERGISMYGNEQTVTIIMDNCSIVANKYPLNIASYNVNPKVIVTNSQLTGYSAFQTHSSNSDVIASFENCTLTGVNKWSGKNDDFATVVINEGVNPANLTFKNCRIEAIEQGTATESLLSAREKGTTVTAEGCRFFMNGQEVTGDAIAKYVEISYPNYTTFNVQ